MSFLKKLSILISLSIFIPTSIFAAGDADVLATAVSTLTTLAGIGIVFLFTSVLFSIV